MAVLWCIRDSPSQCPNTDRSLMQVVISNQFSEFCLSVCLCCAVAVVHWKTTPLSPMSWVMSDASGHNTLVISFKFCDICLSVHVMSVVHWKTLPVSPMSLRLTALMQVVITLTSNDQFQVLQCWQMTRVITIGECSILASIGVKTVAVVSVQSETFVFYDSTPVVSHWQI